MILKKPYGFYKRNYKIIHILLLVPMLYLFFVYKDIGTFLSEYIKSSFKTTETDLISTYFTSLSQIALYFMIFSEAFIFWLEKSKKKDGILYLVSLIYYIFVVIAMIFFHNAFDSIEAGTMSETYVIFIRDLANVVKIPPFILMIWTLLTSFGFNIKTLSFEKRYDNIVTEEDDELVELNFGPDTYTSKKNIVHVLREAKYYILENKFVMKSFLLLIGIILLVKGYMYFGVENRQYGSNQSFALNSITMTLKDSYITDVDYSGNQIENGMYYLAVKIGLQNNSQEPVSIDKANFQIDVNGEHIFPDYSRSSRFKDIGKEYLGNTLLGITKDKDNKPVYHYDDYVLVYELTKEQVKNQYEIKVLSNFGLNSNNKLVANYKKIKIKPKNIVNKEKVETFNKGKEISLASTLLGKTTYKLIDYQLTTNYKIKYKTCNSNNECNESYKTIGASGGKILLILKDNLEYDQTTSYYKNSKLDFYGDFASIKYKTSLSDKTYTTKLEKVNLPSGYVETDDDGNNVRIYEVSQQMNTAINPVLKLMIRNKEININLE